MRSTESLALSILRLIEEDAMKDNTVKIVAQLPVTVATYLLNEKREAVSEIEHRQRVSVLLIPNNTFESPHFEIERIRAQDVKPGKRAQHSYELSVEREISTDFNRDVPKLPAEQPAVQDIIPLQPAPLQQKIAVKKEGFFKRLLGGLFAAEPLAESKPKKTSTVETATASDNAGNAQKKSQQNRRTSSSRGRSNNQTGRQNQSRRQRGKRSNDADSENAQATSNDGSGRSKSSQASIMFDQNAEADGNRVAIPEKEQNESAAADANGNQALTNNSNNANNTGNKKERAPERRTRATGSDGEPRQNRRGKRGGRRRRRDRDGNLLNANGSAPNGDARATGDAVETAVSTASTDVPGAQSAPPQSPVAATSNAPAPAPVAASESTPKPVAAPAYGNAPTQTPTQGGGTSNDSSDSKPDQTAMPVSSSSGEQTSKPDNSAHQPKTPSDNAASRNEQVPAAAPAQDSSSTVSTASSSRPDDSASASDKRHNDRASATNNEASQTNPTTPKAPDSTPPRNEASQAVSGDSPSRSSESRSFDAPKDVASVVTNTQEIRAEKHNMSENIDADVRSSISERSEPVAVMSATVQAAPLYTPTPKTDIVAKPVEKNTQEHTSAANPAATNGDASKSAVASSEKLASDYPSRDEQH